MAEVTVNVLEHLSEFSISAVFLKERARVRGNNNTSAIACNTEA